MGVVQLDHEGRKRKRSSLHMTVLAFCDERVSVGSRTGTSFTSLGNSGWAVHYSRDASGGR